MENKINIAELLKDCPKGMELDCVIWNNPVILEDVVEDSNPYPIRVASKDFHHHLTKYGYLYEYEDAKCVIFPKGKTTWEGFIPPCKFKIEKGKWYVCIKDLLDNYTNKAFCKGDTYLSTQDGSLIPSNSNVPFKVVFKPDTYFRDWTIQDAKDGDVLFHSDSASNGIFIFKEISQRGTMQKVICYCDYDSEDGFCFGENHTCCWTDSKILHPATKGQCNLLFQKIKEAGYKWNAENKTLEELPKFKTGDKLIHKDNKIHCTLGVYAKGLRGYHTSIGLTISDKELDEWELAPNKFDTTTLKPFDKVLYRMYDKDTWCNSFYSFYKSSHHFVIPLTIARQCIPYEGNEHLLGTTDDCEEFYKTWEE